MKKRVFRGIFLESCLILCLSVVFIMGMLYNYFSKIIMNEIKGEINYISTGVEQNGLSYLQEIDAGDSRVTWIAENGDIIFDSQKNASDMENHSDREEVQAAINNGTGESYRYSNTLGEMTFYYAKLLDDGSVLRISGSRYTVFSLLKGVLLPIIFILILSFIISIFVSGRISERIIKPLNNIDFNNMDNIETYEELSPFIRKISSQNRQISEQMEELDRKKQEFTTITENMSEGLIVFDKNTDILLHNTSAKKLLGADEVGEKQSIFTLNRSDTFMTAVNKALKGEHSENIIKLEERIYQIIANPVYNDREIAGGVILILDVTEKEERENLRREFSANVSHELKTPLTSISGFAEIMKNGMVKEEDMKHFAENIYNEARRLITLVGDIIKISKFDENTDIAEKEDVNLLKIVNENIDRLKQVAEQNQVDIVTDCEDITIFGMYSVLDEMVYNLCENAIKYNKKGGSVKISLKKVNENTVFTVKDTGIGIPYTEQSRVFERFYRVDKSHSKEIGGTGLGLSIVKHGAAMHNASIDLKSEIDKGTRISIIF